ncbi:MAG: type II secretion system protein GspG [Candidatus Moranbacteria bacterium]|nr:type II secretion system protein GspG [Candidatus Moranbacteria bacterium]
MGTSLLQLVMALGTGAIMINGVAMSAPDIIANAKDVANAANVHQLSIALELYNLDHNAYPLSSNGAQMVNTLYAEGYIQNKPMDSTVFEYTVKAGGNEYTLKKI